MKSKFWKVLLHKDSFLLIITLVWLWFTVTMLVDANYDFQKLQSHYGQIKYRGVVITKMKNKLLYKDTTRELRIALLGEAQYFEISTTRNIYDLADELSPGDTVTIYTKGKILGIFGFGNERTIVHLVKRPNEVLVDFKKNHRHFASLVFLPALATVAFLIWYIIKIRRRLWRELGGYEMHLKIGTTDT